MAALRAAALLMRGHVPGQIGRVAYGVLHNSDDAGNADYMTGVEVADFSNVPVAFTRLRVAAQLRCVHPPPAHLRDSPHLVHDLEQVAAAACK